jgi:diadenosine tetraphosphate (Ap4A) HIT family hydrolase
MIFIRQNPKNYGYFLMVIKEEATTIEPISAIIEEQSEPCRI